MQKRTISDFYEKDVPGYGSYDLTRKLCGPDGLKLSQRKIIWAAFKRCFSESLKTDLMCAQTQIDTCYVHGAANLEGVIDVMAANYVGANNYPLLAGNSGGFGCRMRPTPAAGRYTRVKLSDASKKLFPQADAEILEKQFFEGQWIEPKTLMPVLPASLLNGSHGISVGFSQEIWPRKPSELAAYVEKKLSGTAKPRMELLPWFRGHKGKVAWNSDLERNESFGVVEKKTSTAYVVVELPIGMEYQKYVETLDKLCDAGVIVDYSDKCDPKTDEIRFELKTTRDFTKKNQDRKLLETLKLVKSLPETFACVDADGRVVEHSCVQDVLDSFIDVRLECYSKRKAWLIADAKAKIEVLSSKWLFVKGVVEKKIHVARTAKADIEKQIAENPKIKQIDGSWDYLLKMPIWSLTAEKMEELKKQILDLAEAKKTIEATTEAAMWKADLKALLAVLPEK